MSKVSTPLFKTACRLVDYGHNCGFDDRRVITDTANAALSAAGVYNPASLSQVDRYMILRTLQERPLFTSGEEWLEELSSLRERLSPVLAARVLHGLPARYSTKLHNFVMKFPDSCVSSMLRQGYDLTMYKDMESVYDHLYYSIGDSPMDIVGMFLVDPTPGRIYSEEIKGLDLGESSYFHFVLDGGNDIIANIHKR